MQKVDKTGKFSSHQTHTPCNKGKKKFKEVYRELDQDEKKRAEGDVFALASSLSQEEGVTTINYLGEVSTSTAAVTSEGTPGEIKLEAVQSQVALIEEKMTDAILMLQKQDGIEETTIILTPPNPCSVFNGSEIVVRQFDSTPPFSFNIDFITDNEFARNLFANNIERLEERLADKEILLNRVNAYYKEKKKNAKRVTGSKNGNR